MRSVFAVAILFTLAASASAQTDFAAITTLRQSNPNGYVAAVQEALSQANYYSGSVTGQLDRQTISAINAVCKAADLSEECGIGPLSERGSSALIEALAQRAKTTETEEAEIIDFVNWKPEFQKNGLQVSIEQNGQAAVAQVTGVAQTPGWINIEASEPTAAVPGSQWRLAIDVDVSVSEGATVAARIAAFRGGKYLGEIDRAGLAIQSGSGSYELIGRVPGEADQLLPYLQITYKEGTEASDVIEFTGAAFAVQPGTPTH